MSSTKNRNNEIKFFIKTLLVQIFEISLYSYLAFLILNELWEKTISNYFDINTLLFTALFSGGIYIVVNFYYEEELNAEVGLKEYLFIMLLGIFSAFVLFSRLEGELWFRLSLTVMSGFLIIIVSFYLLNNSKDGKI